jgi:hypothetical protein
MKKLILLVAAASAVLGIGLYAGRPKPQANPSAETSIETADAPASEEPSLAEPKMPLIEPTPGPTTRPAETQPVVTKISRPPAAPANPSVDAAMLSQAVDLLVSPSANYLQKRDAWKQLRESGKLDQAIADLERRMANNPQTAEYPAALGQAYLKKCGTIQDVREQGILAMQADKLFDAALTLDQSNWEARFTKAVALTYWPPSLNKGGEVIQHFETLVQQQEAQTPQSYFAETYAWLGEQYQKAGREDEARAAWQRGAAIFPADEKLRSKLASHP